MTAEVVFGINVAFSFLVWGLVTRRYIWPALLRRSREDALRILLYLHAFRFVGLAFVVPGVVSPDLPSSFAMPAAYGDLVTAILALFSIAALKHGAGIFLAWICNLVGTIDLLHAFYEGNRSGVGDAPGLQGAAYFIATALVPLLLIAHALAFRLLLRKET